MDKSQLIKIIGRASQTDTNELLLECMDRYGANNTRELTIEQLREFINIKTMRKKGGRS